MTMYQRFFLQLKTQNPTGCSYTTTKEVDGSVIYNNFFSQDVCDTCSLSKSLLKAALLRVRGGLKLLRSAVKFLGW